MKKRTISLWLALCMALAWLPTGAWAADASGDFTIENGVLTKYTGAGGDVVIPDGVTGIEEGAFWECGENVTSVTIPDSVTSIGEDAFEGLYSLASFSVGENNTAYRAVEGVLFDKAGAVLVRYPAKRAGSGYAVPDGVTGIGIRAFAGCAGLTDIMLPDSVNSVGMGAFAGCVGLTEMTIPDGVTRIEEGAFGDCTGLTSVVLPDSVTSIGHGAFGGCADLTNITLPDDLTTIEDAAFYGCAALTDITIPRGVTSMGSLAFDESGLSAFAVAEGNRAYKAVDGVLFNKAGTELLRYPPRKGGNSYAIPDGVTSIGPCAFMSCGGLTEIALPDNLMNIGDSAFAECGGLIGVKLPDSVTSIGSGAFQGCSSLTEVTVPRRVASIGDFAFCDCANLASVTILNPAVKFADSYWVFDYPCTAVIYGYAGSTAETYCEMFKGIFENTFLSLGEAPAPVKPLTDDMVSLPDGYTATYDKTAHTPAVTVKDGGKTLVLDTDYTVAYENNTNAGEAAVTVTGEGGYEGAVTKTFTISPAALAGTVAVTLTGDKDGDGVPDAEDMVALEMTDGKELVTENGTVKLKDGAEVIAVTVAWFRDGEPIEGVNGLSYIIEKADQGKSVAAQIAPRDTNNYTGTLTASVCVPAVKPAPSTGVGVSVPTAVKRAVSVGKASNGSVSLSAKSAKKGDAVTVTVEPDKGYRLESLTVTDRNKKAVELTDTGGGKYTFTMPGAAVTVIPVFARETTAPAEPPRVSGAEAPVAAGLRDVAETDWFHRAVQYVFDKGIMPGLTEDTFGPDERTSRAEIAAILYRLEGEPEVAGDGFSDVAENEYYYKAVVWAAAKGIVKGVEDHTFRPNDDVTREQLAAMLYRYGSYKGRDMSERAELSGYSDVELIGGFAVEAMSWATAAGVLSGTDWGGLHPGGSATRAETAAILMRYCEGRGK